LCRMLVAKGAKVIVGDSPGGLYTAPYVNAVYAATGVKAVTEAGAELNHDFTHAHADNPRGIRSRNWNTQSILTARMR
ncbi:MAG: hypothetical protein IKY06_06920, partial [Clostridia bacterium]|nr:hypothetical protein [Clostridia bacterium]